MLKSIPIANGITLANLTCGLLAIPLALNPDTSHYAFYLVLLAAVLDFFDGFVARLLGQEGPLGQQLDSLADLVSFGVVPGLIWKSWMETKMLLLPYLGMKWLTMKKQVLYYFGMFANYYN